MNRAPHEDHHRSPWREAAQFTTEHLPLVAGTVGLWALGAATTIWAVPPGPASVLAAAVLALLYPLPTAALAIAAANPDGAAGNPYEPYRAALRRYPAVAGTTAVAYAAVTAALAPVAAVAAGLQRSGAWAPLVWAATAVTAAVFLVGVVATFLAPLNAALSSPTAPRSNRPRSLLRAAALPLALLERLFGRVPILLLFGLSQLGFVPRTLGVALAALSAAPLALAIAAGAKLPAEVRLAADRTA